ncbi:MAG: dUTP diphosphatase [Clostridia bacterium]|nr:dUTP diphosphatase [Clostridia bacterium]
MKKLTTIEVTLDEGAFMPQRAHAEDAGLDIFSREDVVIPARGAHVFNTGVHFSIPAGYVGLIKSKSGLNVKHGLQTEGVIDAGYTGAIITKVYNHSDVDYTVRRGDKITQLVIIPVETPVPILVDGLDKTDRGEGGFGSTGR